LSEKKMTYNRCPLFIALLLVVGVSIEFIFCLSQQCGDDVVFVTTKNKVDLRCDGDCKAGEDQTIESAEECYMKCKDEVKCKTSLYNSATKECKLKTVNRFSINAHLKLESNWRLYEKRLCSKETKIQYLGTVYNAKSCRDVYQKGHSEDGVYGVLRGDKYRPMMCKNLGERSNGWTVVQRRYNGEQDFAQNWESYKNGFGRLNGEFWYGNQNLHEMTNDGRTYDLLFIVETASGYHYPLFKGFKIKSENELFEFKDNNNWGEGMGMLYHYGRAFSTYDKDNDAYSENNCSEMLGSGGWWFEGCGPVNLNGLYGVDDVRGIRWERYAGTKSLISIEMLIRRR